MTRFLSESLQAPEPYFRTALRRLELAHGNPSADIRLTSEVHQALRTKLVSLGLDPSDTTPKELYLTLQTRIRNDDARLTKRLRTLAATHISLEADVVAGMAYAIQALPIGKQCYALKPSSFKAIIKKLPPKRAMKQLGYRSLESMLKHESSASILAAAQLSESATWLRSLLERYKHLTPTDFETRAIGVTYASDKRWQKLAQASVAERKHNVLAFPELGAIVLLPLPAQAPAGAVTASLALTLHAVNEIKASSTFLKLCQVRPDFGSVVQSVAQEEPHLQASLLDRSVPWQLVQRYYARMQHHFHEELFEPHIRLEDLSWHGIEQAMALIEPSLHFWQESHHLAQLHDRQPVSMNVIDAALNLCNQLPFERRISSYFQKSLWHELCLRYLKHDTVEQAVLAELQPQFAFAPVSA
ncbi:MAG: hypothetical protein JWM81_1003 [Candidatus Saccharibacteria bacterium]|nr:hypothetical protein [Candidatus Saccharibacteria bacterium]